MTRPVADLHADTFWRILDGKGTFAANRRGHADRPRLAAAGVALQFEAVYTTAEEAAAGRALVRTLEMIALVAAQTAGDDDCYLVRWRGDLDRFPAGLGLLLHLEGAGPLGGSLLVLESLHRLGLRSLGLTHNFPNEAAGGCFGTDDGLTDFGVRLIGRMGELGVLLDLAHAGPRSFAEALEAASGPVVVSHTGMRALVDSPRNLTDDQAAAVSATGGLIGIDFVPGHVSPDYHAGACVDDVLLHLDHAVQKLGVEHVGLGSDFDGYDSPTVGLEDVLGYPRLLERLSAAGYSDDEIDLMAHGNVLRVLRAILPRP